MQRFEPARRLQTALALTHAALSFYEILALITTFNVSLSKAALRVYS